MLRAMIRALLPFLAALSLASAASAQSRHDPRSMIMLWHEANAQCRGSSIDNPDTQSACEERETYSKRLDQLGWCYGKRGEAGYQMKWHRCTRQSIRFGG